MKLKDPRLQSWLFPSLRLRSRASSSPTATFLFLIRATGALLILRLLLLIILLPLLYLFQASFRPFAPPPPTPLRPLGPPGPLFPHPFGPLSSGGGVQRGFCRGWVWVWRHRMGFGLWRVRWGLGSCRGCVLRGGTGVWGWLGGCGVGVGVSEGV